MAVDIRDPHFHTYAKVPCLFNKLGLKDGTPFPKGYPIRERHEPISREPADRYPLGHPPPPLSERWLDGTLYTWPDHDPALLSAQAAEPERSTTGPMPRAE